VVRWFGGTRLGKGGLARAYAAAAKAAIAEAGIVERVPRVELSVVSPYVRLGAVRRLLRPGAVVLLEERYGEDVALRLAVERERAPALRAALADLGLAASEVIDARPGGR
jgi:putative IMPACT (imprinted ancient) family translation regulator